MQSFTILTYSRLTSSWSFRPLLYWNVKWLNVLGMKTLQDTQVGIFSYSFILEHKRTTKYRYNFLKIRSNIKKKEMCKKQCYLLKRRIIGVLETQVFGLCFTSGQHWKLGANPVPSLTLFHLAQHCAIERSVEMKMYCISAVYYGSYQPRVAIEHLNVANETEGPGFFIVFHFNLNSYSGYRYK